MNQKKIAKKSSIEDDGNLAEIKRNALYGKMYREMIRYAAKNSE